MPRVRDFYECIDRIAPYHTAGSWDNCGLQIGSPTQEVTGCVVALDVTADVVAYALKMGANLLVTHHPVIFHALRSIRHDAIIGQLISRGMASISAHTNLDAAAGGVNDALFYALGLMDPEPFPNEYNNIGKIGRLPHGMPAPALAAYAKDRLGAEAVRCSGSKTDSKIIEKVAIISGAGGDCLAAAKDAGADALLTGEAKHSDFVDAVNMGIPLLAAGHHDTEKVVLVPLCEQLRNAFPKIPIVTYTAFPAFTIG